MNEAADGPMDIPEKSEEDEKPSRVTIIWENVYNGDRVTAMRAPIPGGWLVRPTLFGPICFVPDACGEWVAE